jgi:nucleoside-diphosphate-sugar epimerase
MQRMGDTVLITGCSGFIAKHVALDCLKAGWIVRGTTRTQGAGEAVRQTLAHHGGDVSRFSAVDADLTSDVGWAEAVAGCRFVLHLAAPFPLQQPRDRESLVPEARGGTLRILKTARAAGVERVVMTSSTVAMVYRPDRPAVLTFSEHDWTDITWPALTAYIVAKTRAEQAAWEDARAAVSESALVVINPGFVLGPALDTKIGTSLAVIQLIMKGSYPAVPPTAFPIVDVRDLSALHVAALTTARVGGRRLLAAADTMSMKEMGQAIKSAIPAHGNKIPSMVLPNMAVRLMAMFDPTLKTVLPDLGCRPIADARYVTDLTGVRFRPAAEAVVAAAQFLADERLV